MTRKPTTVYRNPLDCYLDIEDDDADALTFLARRFVAEPFDEGAFRTELDEKLKLAKYRPAGPNGNEETFHKILEEAGVLDELLRTETLRELWKCKLLMRIVRHSRDLENENKAVDGKPLRQLKDDVKQLYGDLRTIEEIAERRKAHKEAENIYQKIERDFRGRMRLLLISTKYKGSRSELLSGQSQEDRKGPQDEGLASKSAIYRTIRPKLLTKKTGEKGLSAILLCQLAELIAAPSGVTKLSDGQSLYTSLYRAARRSS
jgi:hypothetical protein